MREAKSKALVWSKSQYFDEKTRQYVSKLLSSDDHEQIQEMFAQELSFGTGGMRGILGAGTSRINIYNIRRATTALSYYLKSSSDNSSLKVAISYDSRHFSRVFAENAGKFQIVIYIQKID